MKKIACFPMISLLLVFLASCTLDMEEWVTSDEDKGYEEPVTVENDYYTLTYKYKPTTRSLTDTIQSYIAQIEADTVLYFMDNIPEKWLPKTGGQVVANCCKMFPMGLIARVLSVERTGGLVKVVTTYADLKDAYDEFDFEFDGIIPASSPEQVDTVQVTRRQGQMTRGMEVDDSTSEVYVDWSIFDEIKRKTRSTRRKKLSDVYSEDMDKVFPDEVHESWSFDFDSDIVKDMLKKATGGKINDISGSLACVHRTWIHKIIKLSQEYEYTETDQTTGLKLSGKVGLTADASAAFLKNKLGKYKEKLFDADEKVKPWVKPFALPGTPIPMFIRIKPVLKFEFGLYGNFEYTWWLSRARQYTEIKDDEVLLDETEDIKTPANEGNFEVSGELHLALGLDATIGIGTKVGDEALGVGLYAILKGNLDFALARTFVGDMELGTQDGVSLSIDATFGARALGAKYGKLDFNFGEPIKIWETSFPYYPKFECSKITPPITTGTNVTQEVKFSITDSGLSNGVSGLENWEPVVLLYENEDDIPAKTIGGSEMKAPSWVLHQGINEEPITTFEPDATIKEGAVKDKEYSFKFYNNDLVEYFAVPALILKAALADPYYYSPRPQIYRNQRQLLPQQHKPVIRYIDSPEKRDGYDPAVDGAMYVYQTKGYGEEMSLSPTPYTYEIMLPFTLYGASAIFNFWSDWGVNIFVTEPNSERHVLYWSFYNCIFKSGNYMVKKSFESSYPYGIKVEAHIKYCPKGEKNYIRIGDGVGEGIHNFEYERYTFTPKQGSLLLMETYEFHIWGEDESSTKFDYSKWKKSGYKPINVGSFIF